MAWSNIKLADVKVESGTFSPIPAGTYTVALLPGAMTRINKFETEELVASAAVAEGDQAGRRIFLQYPDPEVKDEQGNLRNKWSAQALKKLETVLGVDQNEGETPVQYLNRVANNGHSHFQITMGPSRRIRTGETEPRIEPLLFSVAPAA